MHDALAHRRRAVLATVVEADAPELVGKKHLLILGEQASGDVLGNDPWKDAEVVSELPAEWRSAVEAVMVRTGTSKARITTSWVDGPGRARIACERFSPPPRMIIAGGGHIAQPTHEIAATVGFAVTVIDDRPSFANPARFPRAERVICDDFTRAVKSVDLDEETAFVVVTRGHAHDFEVVRALVGRPLAYLGMIGSRRRVLTVLDALRAEGAPEAFVRSIYAPIGLDIGADAPAEIALAIVAEVVSVMRGGRGVHCRDRLKRRAHVRKA